MPPMCSLLEVKTKGVLTCGTIHDAATRSSFKAISDFLTVPCSDYRVVMLYEASQKKSLLCSFPKSCSEKLFLPNTHFKTAITLGHDSDLNK